VPRARDVRNNADSVASIIGCGQAEGGPAEQIFGCVRAALYREHRTLSRLIFHRCDPQRLHIFAQVTPSFQQIREAFFQSHETSSYPLANCL
jgi:hypothetical protein